MATLGANPVFIDTNVLVYANVAGAPLHQTALTTLQNLWNGGNQLWVSRQVLREYIATVTRPQSFSQPQPISTVVARVRYFQTHFKVAESGPTVTEKLLDLISQVTVQGKQVHDANIVATMQAHGLSYLLTHNTGDFNRFANYITVIPIT